MGLKCSSGVLFEYSFGERLLMFMAGFANAVLKVAVGNESE